MALLEKLENLLNQWLLKLGALCARLVPAPVYRLINLIQMRLLQLRTLLAGLPALLKNFGLGFYSRSRNQLSTTSWKDVLAAAMVQAKKAAPGEKMNSVRVYLAVPFALLSQWLKGLSAAQSLLLLAFTGASILSGINIVSSGHRVVKGLADQGRAPASVETSDGYDRPDYYKKETRHLEFSAVRIPVYVADVNELRSVDIDFIVTMNTRESRMKLEKKEFQLRDHLVLNLEPSVASFPLEDEGKEILRQKLQEEVNEFLKDQSLPGVVAEVKITYILAN